MIVEVWFVIFSLAVFRAAEALAHDYIFDSLRRAVGRKAAGKDDDSFWFLVAKWIHCPLCIGVWIAVPATIIFNAAFLSEREWWLGFPVWLGMSGLQYFLSAFLMGEDTD